MKTNKLTNKVMVFAVVLFSVTLSTAWAKPTTSKQATVVVQKWRQMDPTPLKASLGKTVREVQTYRDGAGSELYHVVYLEPAGFAIVPADDLVEPIIAFSSEGTYDPSKTNPLGALVNRDLPGRIAHVRGIAYSTANKSASLTSEQTAALSKWERLQGSEPDLAYGLVTVSDVRVAPLIQSKWNQSTVSGTYCYNYYTPNNYVSGCVATAMAQLMRLHQLPISAVGTASFTIYVDSVSRSESLMGGDGAGGAYSWAQMPLVPDGTITLTQRQAIGRLMHDAGATVNMSYTADGSGAVILKTATALKTTFGYGNAKQGYNGNDNIPTEARNTMVNPNLDAGLPVLFGIFDESVSGHAVVGDGYGYQSGTMYHHLNMGWSGSNDLWYNLPNIDDSYYGFTSIDQIVYNVFPSGSGEIVSGRVVDCGGAPINGVAVTALLNGSVKASATTNSNGIYALKGLSSATTYIIAATKIGYNFTSNSTTTGTSSDNTTVSGNKWGIDFSNLCSYSTLTVTKAGAGSGTVTSTPAGISCGTTCSVPFAKPSSITLTASANSGSVFTGWSGGSCTGVADCTVNLTGDTTVTATFVPYITLLAENFDGVSPSALPSGWQSLASGATWATHVATVHPVGKAAHSGSNLVYFNSWTAASGSSAALVSPAFPLTGTNTSSASFWMYRDTGLSPKADSVEVYINTSASLNSATLLGTIHRLTTLSPVVASAGWYKYEFPVPASFASATNHLLFKGISDYGNDIHIDDVTVAGRRDETEYLIVTLGGTGGGSVTSDPVGISCGAASCSAVYPYGTNVKLYQTPNSLSTIGGWSGACSAAGACSITMDTAKTVYAYFTQASKAMIGATGYDSLNLAYSGADDSGSIIMVLDTELIENLIMDKGKTITLVGGYKADYGSRSGLLSTLKGVLTIATGELMVDGLVIR
ncbi:MAG: C10 family peptidase [Desulfuromonadales bacterium]|nr:C10 family peptidase [Desulfuromonadales bacterium]